MAPRIGDRHHAGQGGEHGADHPGVAGGLGVVHARGCGPGSAGRPRPACAGRAACAASGTTGRPRDSGGDEHDQLVGVERDVARQVPVVWRHRAQARREAHLQHRGRTAGRMVDVEDVDDARRRSTRSGPGWRRAGRRSATILADSDARARGAEDGPVEEEAEQGGEHEDRPRKRRRHDGPVHAPIELVVDVGGGEGHAAIGEVEDARGRVRQRQTRRPPASRWRRSPRR